MTRRRLRKLWLLLATIFILNAVCLVPIPLVEATPTLQNGISATYTFTEDLHGIDVTSNGTVFANADGDTFKSVDNGTTWAKVLDGVDPLCWIFLIRASTLSETLFTATGNVTDCKNDVHRSDDYGVTWTKVMEDVPRIWRMTEMTNGTILMNTYTSSVVDAVIYKSDDDGQTWSVFQNMSTQVSLHIHSVRVNPYTDDIWVCSGDTVGNSIIAVWYSGASAWVNITKATLYTDILFDSTYVYFIPDTAYTVYRIPHAGTWADIDECMNLLNDDTTTPAGFAYSMMGAMYSDGSLVFGTDRETVFASLDGARWLKVFQTTYGGAGAWRIDYLSQKQDANGYWYFINDYTETVYRAKLNLNDLYTSFGKSYNGYFGTQSESKLQIPAQNGARLYFNVTDSRYTQFTKLKVTATGLTKGNFISNYGFETGTTSGWTIGGVAAAYGVTTADAQDGTYSLNINKSTTDSDNFYIETANSQMLYEYGEKWYAFIYAKANTTVLNALKVQIGYYSGVTWISVSQAVATLNAAWVKTTTSGFQSLTPRTLYVRFIAAKNATTNYSVYFDTLLWERKVQMYGARKVNGGDTAVYKAGFNAQTASTTLYPTAETKDINIQLTGYATQLTYTGNLTEEATTSAMLATVTQNYFEILVTVSGSEQVLLIITYSPFYTDTLSDYNLAQNTAGRAYVLYGNATITDFAYTDATDLSFTVDAETDEQSINVFYSPIGEPYSVTGANYYYDHTTKLLNIYKTHSGPATPATVTVIWSTSGAAGEAATGLSSFLLFLAEGDWLGFLQAIYISAFMSADLFYGFIILLIMAPIYIRTRSLILVCILWILIGSGLIVAAPMVAALGIAFMALGIAGVLLKIFTSLR